MSDDDYSLDQIREAVTRADASAPSVSQWSVGMHVHHLALTMINIGNGLAKSTQPAPPAKRSIAKHIVFTLGKIPRGRARTTKNGTPQPSVPAPELLALIDESARQMDAAAKLDRNTWITHPIFGPLRRDDALRFVSIHNRHHLRIVADILRQRRAG
jgi:DinB superfamily